MSLWTSKLEYPWCRLVGINEDVNHTIAIKQKWSHQWPSSFNQEIGKMGPGGFQIIPYPNLLRLGMIQRVYLLNFMQDVNKSSEGTGMFLKTNPLKRFSEFLLRIHKQTNVWNMLLPKCDSTISCYSEQKVNPMWVEHVFSVYSAI